MANEAARRAAAERIAERLGAKSCWQGVPDHSIDLQLDLDSAVEERDRLKVLVEGSTWVCGVCGESSEAHGMPNHPAYQCVYHPVLKVANADLDSALALVAEYRVALTKAINAYGSHWHVAQYTPTRNVMDECTHCGKDFRDEIHLRSGESRQQRIDEFEAMAEKMLEGK